jgi:thiamine transport system substrate-binding protein
LKKILILLILFLFVFACNEPVNENKLIVYTYDSMVSDYGLGPKIIELFEEKYDCKIELISTGDAGTLINRLILEQNSRKADVVLGIDNSMSEKILKENLLQEINYGKNLIEEKYWFDETNKIIPFDYGFIAFVYDSRINMVFPNSLKELSKPEYKNKFILIDPRTSSPGKMFLDWTINVLPENELHDYWKKINSNALIIASGWSEAYNMFLAGEAPMVLSYATSPAYHVEFEEINYIKALEFIEGHPIQIEGMAILKGTQKQELAEKFIEFMLSEEIQKEIPLTQFMYPVRKNIELPESFNSALKPVKEIKIQETEKDWIQEWEKTI